jgi:hypothetical protein
MANKNSFKYFKTTPEIIRLAVMYYVLCPLSFRQVEDILHERGIDMGLLRPTVTVQKPLAPRTPLFLGWAFWLAALYNKCHKFIRG